MSNEKATLTLKEVGCDRSDAVARFLCYSNGTKKVNDKATWSLKELGCNTSDTFAQCLHRSTDAMW